MKSQKVTKDSSDSEERDYPPLNKSLINERRCKNSYCHNRNQPHIHQIETCKNHEFCLVEKQKPKNDTKEIVPVPFANDPETQGIPISDLGVQVIVTDYSLAHWQAQILGYDINDLKIKSDLMGTEFYEKVFRQWKEVSNKPEGNQPMIPEQIINMKIIELKSKIKTNEIKLDQADSKVTPLIYPSSKQLLKFKEFERKVLRQKNQGSSLDANPDESTIFKAHQEQQTLETSKFLTFQENLRNNIRMKRRNPQFFNSNFIGHNPPQAIFRRLQSDHLNTVLSREEIFQAQEQIMNHKELVFIQSPRLTIKKEIQTAVQSPNRKNEDASWNNRRNNYLKNIMMSDQNQYIRQGKTYSVQLNKLYFEKKLEQNPLDDQLTLKSPVLKKMTKTQAIFGHYSKTRNQRMIQTLQPTQNQRYQQLGGLQKKLRPKENDEILKTKIQKINFQNVEQSKEKEIPVTDILEAKQVIIDRILPDKNIVLKQTQAFKVSEEDFNDNIPEPENYYMTEIQITLKLFYFKAKESNFDGKNIFEIPEFWLSKGCVIYNEQLTLGNAISYFDSGVKIDPTNFGCIYNIGCCFFFQQKYANAKKWFNLALKVEANVDSYYGKAACCLKLGQYEEALESIQAIDKDDWQGEYDEETNVCNDSKNYKWFQITYLHALVLKILGKFQLASQRYQKLESICRAYQSEQLKNVTCSLMLLPLQKSRQMIEDILMDFLELVKGEQLDDYFDQNIQENIQTINQENKKIGFMVEYLTKFFPFNQIETKEIKRLLATGLIEILELEHNKVLPLTFQPKQDSEVFVVLNGKINLKKHLVDQPNEFIKVCSVKRGSFVGIPDLDEGISSKPDIWCTVASKSANVVKMTKYTFDKMWTSIIKSKKQIQLIKASQSQFFNCLSPLTQYRVVNDIGQRKSYKAGELVMNQHIRSAWNWYGNAVYRKSKPIIRNLEDGAKKMGVGQQQQSYGGESAYVALAKNINKVQITEEKKAETLKKINLKQNRSASIYQEDKIFIPWNRKSYCSDVFYIMRGSAKIVLKDWTNNDRAFEVAEIKSGQVFGISDVIRVVGIEFFGDVVAGADGMECLVLNKPDQILDFKDIQALRKVFQSKNDGLNMVLHTQHKFLRAFQILNY